MPTPWNADPPGSAPLIRLNAARTLRLVRQHAQSGNTPTLADVQEWDREYSHRQVGDHLGVSGVVIAGIEEGTNHADLPLRLVSGLADLLGVPVGRLFTYQPADDDATTIW